MGKESVEKILSKICFFLPSLKPGMNKEYSFSHSKGSKQEERRKTKKQEIFLGLKNSLSKKIEGREREKVKGKDGWTIKSTARFKGDP